MMWGFGGWGALWMVVFWVTVVAAIAWAVRPASTPGGHRLGESAIEILRARYARGEIDADEFRSRRAELKRK